MKENRIVLIGGGVRSGKSAFALARARSLGARRALIATAQALDSEMKERIARHRRERGDDFRTIEEATDLPAALAALRDVDVAVVDCLTLWVSNLLLRDETSQAILRRVDELTAVLRRCPFHTIIVTNEVGMGVVPETPLGRTFRDLCGRAHQRLAEGADEIYVTILGSVLRIKPGPVEVQPMGAVRAALE